MSHIDDLIARLCPDGVEFKPLGEVAAYSETRVDADQLDQHTFTGVDNLLPDKAGRTAANYAPNTAVLTEYRLGDVLLGNIRPYLKKVWLADSRGGCSGDVLAVRINTSFRARVIPEFLYLILSSDAFFAFNTQNSKGAKMPRGDKAAILRFRIPLPPVDVQLDIVKILDFFSSLEAELEAELEARNRQYAHYRNSLFEFSNQRVQRSTFGAMGDIFRGRRFTKADYVDDGIGAIHYGELYTRYGISAESVVTKVRQEMGPTLRYAEPGDVVIAEVGETVDDVGLGVAWVGDQRVAVHDGCFVLRLPLNPVYVSHYLRTEAFRAEKDQFVSRAKVKRLLFDGIKRISIPVPPLAEQAHIAGILDSFDALVNDLSIGLPAELTARRQQYEYYRDRLLTFKEAS